MAKTYIDYMSEQDYERFNQLLAKATEAKANAPKKERAPKGPMTIEQKIKMAESRRAKAEAKVAELLAQQAQG